MCQIIQSCLRNISLVVNECKISAALVEVCNSFLFLPCSASTGESTETHITLDKYLTGLSTRVYRVTWGFGGQHEYVYRYLYMLRRWLHIDINKQLHWSDFKQRLHRWLIYQRRSHYTVSKFNTLRPKWPPFFRRHFQMHFFMKMHTFRLRFHWSLFPRVQLTIFQHWFR